MLVKKGKRITLQQKRSLRRANFELVVRVLLNARDKKLPKRRSCEQFAHGMNRVHPSR